MASRSPTTPGRVGGAYANTRARVNLETFPTLPRPSRHQVIHGQNRHRAGRVGRVGKVWSVASMCAPHVRANPPTLPRLPATPNASRLSAAQQRAWIDPGHPACGEPGPARTARPGPAFQGPRGAPGGRAVRLTTAPGAPE